MNQEFHHVLSPLQHQSTSASAGLHTNADIPQQLPLGRPRSAPPTAQKHNIMEKQFSSPLPGGFPNIPSSIPEDAVSVVNEKPPTVFSQFSETP